MNTHCFLLESVPGLVSIRYGSNLGGAIVRKTNGKYYFAAEIRDVWYISDKPVSAEFAAAWLKEYPE